MQMYMFTRWLVPESESSEGSHWEQVQIINFTAVNNKISHAANWSNHPETCLGLMFTEQHIFQYLQALTVG